MTRWPLLLPATALLALGATLQGAAADSCRAPADGARRSREAPCLPAQRLEPYDPGRVRAGRNPGFIDLGNGTEVRVGGRTGVEYNMRAR